MPDWLLRVEAVNFAATMDDTSDLSTQRGASLVALNAGEAVRRRLEQVFDPDGTLGAIERVYVGASQALFRLKAGVDPQQALAEARRFLASPVGHPLNRPLYPKPREERAPPVATMTFVAEVEADEGEPEKVLHRLEAKLKRLQFQSPTLRPHRRARKDRPFACPIEGRLPADRGISVRLEMHENAWPLADYAPRDEKVIAVSRSVAERRSYGRSARQRFYDVELSSPTGLRFADGLIDLVNAPPDTVPLPLQGKIAVINADGIGFGDILAAAKSNAGNAVLGLKDFSDQVAGMNREKILAPLVDQMRQATARGGQDERAVSVPHERADNPDARRHGWPPILRFETLTYAGEDIVWLVPSWLAWEVVGFLLEATKGAVIAKQAPAYRVGCVVCSHKMPIRKAKGLAHDLAYLVTEGVPEDKKAAGLQLELVESIDVSDGYLGAHRARLAGAAGPERFTIAAEHLEAVEKHVRALRLPRGLPPSQLHRLLRLAAQRKAFTDAAARAEVLDALEDTLERGGYHYGAGGDALTVEHLACEALGAEGDPLFGLLRLAQLWDVVLPLGQPVLRVPGQ